MGDYENGTWYLDMAVEGALWMREYVPDEKIAWFENHDEANMDDYQLVIQAGHMGEIILKYPVWDAGMSNNDYVKITSIHVDEKDKRYLVRFLTNLWMDPLVTHGYDFMDFRKLIEGSPLKFKCAVIDSMNGHYILEKCAEILPLQCSDLTGYVGYSGEFERFDEFNDESFFDYSMRFMEWFKSYCNDSYVGIICECCDQYLKGEKFEFGIWYR